ncbi:MAG TPA: hypothetical protein VGG48_01675 [Rhizomicrobium sp.]|jgi:hypothetical protein
MTAIDPAGRYTREQVAELVLGQSARWFSEHRATLHRLEGFPQPISHIGRPRWRGSDLLAWLERPRNAETPQAPNVTHLAEILRKRAKAVASAG